MFFPRSGVVAATLLVLQSTLSIATPLWESAVHELEKRITCNANEVPINNACVSCASRYTNATTCSRSEPLTCSYGVVNSARKCAAVDCTKTPGTYLSTDAKECLDCADPAALTCNSTSTITCMSGNTLFRGQCYRGTPYALYGGYGLSRPYLANQQPYKPFAPADGNSLLCLTDEPKARVVYYTGVHSTALCTGQNGPLDQNLVRTTSGNTFVALQGYCADFAKNSFVNANRADAVCGQYFISPEEPIYVPSGSSIPNPP